MRADHCSSLLALLAVLFLLAGCDSSFDPYAETDQPFSLFGVLDASDEHHYVRVEPLQDGRPFGADSVIDATATLAHLGTGREITLDDSLIAFQGVKHNFTGEMNLQLDNAYRLTVRRSDGQASTATFTTPHEVPLLSLSEFGTSATVEGGTEDRLFYLTVHHHTCISPEDPMRPPYGQTFTVRHTEHATRTETGYAASYNWRMDVDSLYSGQEATAYLNEVEVQAGLVHPSTPDYDGLSYEELFRPGAAPSNVENGVGFVASLTNDEASLTFPLGERPCTELPSLAHCPIPRDAPCPLSTTASTHR